MLNRWQRTDGRTTGKHDAFAAYYVAEMSILWCHSHVSSHS